MVLLARKTWGFSFVEMVLAVGLLAITILTLAFLSLTIIRSTTKSNDRISATAVCNTILDKTIKKGQNDPSFWSGDWSSTPYDTGKQKFGKIEYKYDVWAETVVDVHGNAIGAKFTGPGQPPDNRLKLVRAKVSWFDTDGTTRQGYGKLEEMVTRLVNEHPTLP